jgi:hypothetical protein
MSMVHDAGAVGTVVVTRRRLLAGTVVLPLAALAMSLGRSIRARAATQTMPSAVRDLDLAAMALFDAAEGGHWPAARHALERARAAAEAMGSVESAYVGAGGQISDFFLARNHLTGDLVEAKTALSVKDGRWLVSSAERIAARAGELSEPFAAHDNDLVPRIETLLFLARRMREALVWQDDIGFGVAHDDFKRLWKALRDELGKDERPDKVHALDEALARVAISRSSTDLKSLYTAIHDLRELARS